MRKMKRKINYDMIFIVHNLISGREDYFKMIQQLPGLVDKFSTQDIEEIKREIIDKVVEYSVSNIENKDKS